MSFRGRPVHALVLLAIGFAIGAITVGGAVAARYITDGDTEVTSIKLTGGGLPDLGAESTYGVAELPSTIRTYHDSGLYDQEIATVDAKAKQLAHQPAAATAQVARARSLLGVQPPRAQVRRVKPAIVLDIDETSLSNYEGLNAAGFSQAGLVPGAVAGNDPVIAPTLELYRFARKKGVEAFFITGRPDVVRTPTETT